MHINTKVKLNLFFFLFSNILLIILLFYINNGYLFLAGFITLSHIRDSFCAIFYLMWKIKNFVCCKQVLLPKLEHTIVAFIPCYSEFVDDILKTISTINNQQKIEQCKLFYIIIVDGQKIAQKNNDHLLNEFNKIFDVLERYQIKYKSWKKTINTIDILLCEYDSHFIILLGKHKNNGKKCSLIIGEELLYNIFRSNDYFDGDEEILHIKNKILDYLKKSEN